MPRVLILVRRLDQDERRLVEEYIGDLAEPIYIDDGIGDEEAGEAVAALVATARNPVVREILRRARNLRFIQTLAAGVDNIPFQDLPEQVVVASNSGANAEEVAEYAVALLLAAAKRIVLLDREMRRGIWRVEYPSLIKGSTVVIWGYGSIGREIARRLQPFKPRIYGVRRSGGNDDYVDRILRPEEALEILPETDYLVIALPLTRETRGAIDSEVLRRLREGAVVVNVGRGPVIDEEALFDELSRGRLWAALDVWWVYPSRRGEETFQDLPFHLLENIVMTPHVAGTWPGYREKLLRHALENLRRFLMGEEPRNIVRREDYI